jgi:dTDP-4-amino-4,6-dideoxygalactose transaminase
MTDAPVPLVDLGRQHADLAAEIDEAVRRVIADSSFVLGPYVEAFESAFAAFSGVRHCVGVANGTDALELALRAVGVGAGDEVILPAHTFIASAVAVVRAGATPVLVDVDERSLLLDTTKVAAALSPRTKAVMPVHLYGQAAPVELLDLPEHVVVVGDAAQAQGACRNGRPVAALATVSGTSFYPGKNIGALGDAGAVLTDDADVAERLRGLRNYGSPLKYHHPVLGFNSRLDALQAAVLSVKLRHLARWNDARRAAAAVYGELLADLHGVTRPHVIPGNEHVWHLYTIRVHNRDDVLQKLNHRGIGAGIHYPRPIHLQGAFASLGHQRGAFPVAEAACDELVSLPLYPEITSAQQAAVVAALRAAIA